MSFDLKHKTGPLVAENPIFVLSFSNNNSEKVRGSKCLSFEVRYRKRGNTYTSMALKE